MTVTEASSYIVEDVERRMARGLEPDQIARQLDTRPASLGKRLRRAGRADLARRFETKVVTGRDQRDPTRKPGMTRDGAQPRIAAIEAGLADGKDANEIANELGIHRNNLRKWCRDNDRPDLSEALQKSSVGRPRSTMAHGTDAAYGQHLVHGEKPCFRCIQGHARVKQLRYAVRRARKDGHVPQILDPTPRDWDVAACLNGNPDDWFALPGQYEEAHRAKMTCLTKCALREACLRMAMESDAEWARDGIYGGMTPAERSLKKRQAS